ncbi:MAG: hypothetical protein JWN41_953 [Thermoleophilia bacterium]|nr:hypothetical protein [Thermoleophilia bacterium]
MTGTELLGVVTSTWGVGMAVSPALQIRAMLKEEDADPISIGYFLVLVVGFILWTAYGIATHSWVLIVPNVISTIFGIGVIATALYVRRRTNRSPT